MFYWFQIFVKSQNYFPKFQYISSLNGPFFQLSRFHETLCHIPVPKVVPSFAEAGEAGAGACPACPLLGPIRTSYEEPRYEAPRMRDVGDQQRTRTDGQHGDRCGHSTNLEEREMRRMDTPVTTTSYGPVTYGDWRDLWACRTNPRGPGGWRPPILPRMFRGEAEPGGRGAGCPPYRPVLVVDWRGLEGRGRSGENRSVRNCEHVNMLLESREELKNEVPTERRQHVHMFHTHTIWGETRGAICKFKRAVNSVENVHFN